MPLDTAWLPVATPLDQAEESPGSLDPLGTLTHAERLAEVLLPGFTVRMWRGRLLTFATVAAQVADRTVELMGNREDLRLEARLAFERLFVAGVVRMAHRDSGTYGNAPLRLPGRDLARNALLEGEPLTRANFLKGQAVNGPFGVIARLAREVKLIEDDGRMGRKAVELLMAWSDDEQLLGVLYEDSTATRAGAVWMAEVVKRTAACVENRGWPGDTHQIWGLLARHLRPDRIGAKERRVLLRLLETDPVRRRILGLLKERADVYHQASRDTGDRGKVERVMLLRGIRPELGGDPADHLIAAVITAVDAYEQISALFQQVFDGLVWALKVRGGRARSEDIIEDSRLRHHLEKTHTRLIRALPLLERATAGLQDQPSVDSTQLVEPILRLRENAILASASVPDLAKVVLCRYERVQREKEKVPWIECESHWTLMPGENRMDSDSPPVWQDTYLHPFKIPNAYSILGDLGQVVPESVKAFP